MSIRVHADEYPSGAVLRRLETDPGVESVETPSEICVDVFEALTRGLTEDEVADLIVAKLGGTPA